MVSIKLLFDKDTAIRQAQRAAEELDHAGNGETTGEAGRHDTEQGESRPAENASDIGQEHHDFQQDGLG